MSLSRRAFLGTALCALGVTAGCVGGGGEAFRTYYDQPVPADVARSWRLANVVVTAPRSLSVSEQRSYEPKADIVWREDPEGDRHAQVEKLMRDAIARGASGLRGSTPVRFEVTMTRFHALTFEAEALPYKNIGVHNVNFIMKVVNARTGEVLVGPSEMEASLPALTGREMIEARVRGETQKSQIQAHVARTIQAWLSLAPDNRGSFSRAGA
ncbi:DUF6778 family protein [Frigidibacter sp. SD6-1]|uniref:DUF6778 family protein n=1 Tax=Frigidibacter sp. SD6-1 TaxID=3032581 RepID=UPI0024E0032D|nr:DUF6778 family protein [Frigidibacter sp. SD6-1]